MWRSDTFRRLNTYVGDVVGAKTAQALASLGIETVWDLVRHLPLRYFNGTESSELATLQPGQTAALIAKVVGIRQVSARGREYLQAVVSDGTDYLELVFFGKDYLIDYWEQELSKGTRGIFVGKVSMFRNQLQMTHPDFVMLDDAGTIVGRATKTKKQMAASVSTSGLVGIYPSTAKLATWQISECEQLALQFLDGITDPVPEDVLAKTGYLDFLDACTAVHSPTTLRHSLAGQQRLRFDEALTMQVSMAFHRALAKANPGYPIVRRKGLLLDGLDSRLPFKLTAGQLQVCDEIFQDMASGVPMQRLLQGDVGSGKTVVALRAMCQVVDNGYQSVLLAPTEVLAAQHAQTIAALLGELGAGQVLGAPVQATEVVLLTGSMSTAARTEVLDKISSGQAGIIVGTHALLAERVLFSDLGLVVVDEQHRFGVEQRARLTERAGVRPHELVMTATPIPRSVAMTIYGDLDISILAQLPAGRAGVQTTVVNTQLRPGWLARAWERAVEEAKLGHQVFVICPKISEADPDEGKAKGASVEGIFEFLTNGPMRAIPVARLNGRLRAEVKDKVMAQFVAGEVSVLVSTTVVEVGVDVPNATTMIILDADRFGISQLHQLRGRIGRGSLPGLCLLVTSTPRGSLAEQRLNEVASTRDGFKLAEADLRLRREGNVLGASQSGKSQLKLLTVTEDAQLIAQARDIASQLVASDPGMASDAKHSESRTLQNPYLADMVTQTDHISDGVWLGRN